MTTKTPWPKHCFHEMSGQQRGEDFRCCWCNEPQREFEKSGHGKFLKGSGDLIDNSGYDCESRRIEDSR